MIFINRKMWTYFAETIKNVQNKFSDSLKHERLWNDKNYAI